MSGLEQLTATGLDRTGPVVTELERYRRRLEALLKVALFDHAGLVERPEAAASWVRAALALGDRGRAEAVVAATECLALERPGFACLAAAAAHARGLAERDAECLTEAADTYGDPWARASAIEDLGVLAAEEGSRDSAAVLWRTARDEYAEVPAPDDVDRLTCRLRNLGTRDA